MGFGEIKAISGSTTHFEVITNDLAGTAGFVTGAYSKSLMFVENMGTYLEFGSPYLKRFLVATPDAANVPDGVPAFPIDSVAGVSVTDNADLYNKIRTLISQ